MNIFNTIIINLLYLISSKVSDIKTMNNKKKKIRLLEDTPKKNSILISIEAKSEGNYNYLNGEFFGYANGAPTELYLDNSIIEFNSNMIYLTAGNHIIEIIYGDKILTTCCKMFYGCPIKYCDLIKF